jgi:hypothetical protein
MWSSDEITLEISEEDVDFPTLVANFVTPAGVISIIGTFLDAGPDTLHIDGVHIGGLAANTIGIAGLNALGRKLLEEANVAHLIIAGSTRTSGRCEGRTPRIIRFPRGSR